MYFYTIIIFIHCLWIKLKHMLLMIMAFSGGKQNYHLIMITWTTQTFSVPCFSRRWEHKGSIFQSIKYIRIWSLFFLVTRTHFENSTTKEKICMLNTQQMAFSAKSFCFKSILGWCFRVLKIGNIWEYWIKYQKYTLKRILAILAIVLLISCIEYLKIQ